MKIATTLILALATVLSSNDVAHGTLIVELGSAQVGLIPGGPVKTASFDIAFSNSSLDPASLAGYTLFLDIAPEGSGLPPGVSFADPAVAYLAGDGDEPLTGASKSAPPNFTPAAGDLGLGQIQFFNGSIGAGEIFTMLTVNLEIDQQTAIVGDYAITLNDDGQNSLDALSSDLTSVIPQPFSVNAGVLSLHNVPEPTALALLAFGGLGLLSRRWLF